MAMADEVLPVLRDGIAHGRWVESMPSAVKLSAETGVHRRAVLDALTMLVRDGTLVRVGNTYLIGGVPPEENTAPEVRERAIMIMSLYGSHVTPQSLAQLPEQRALVPGRHREPYDVFRLAVDSFRGHTSTAVRSALGWRDSTSSHRTATARRTALSQEIKVPAVELARLERAGSLILAGHIESVVALLDQGLLRLEHQDLPPAPSEVERRLRDLLVRVRTLEMDAGL